MMDHDTETLRDDTIVVSVPAQAYLDLARALEDATLLALPTIGSPERAYLVFSVTREIPSGAIEAELRQARPIHEATLRLDCMGWRVVRRCGTEKR